MSRMRIERGDLELTVQASDGRVTITKHAANRGPNYGTIDMTIPEATKLVDAILVAVREHEARLEAETPSVDHDGGDSLSSGP